MAFLLPDSALRASSMALPPPIFSETGTTMGLMPLRALLRSRIIWDATSGTSVSCSTRSATAVRDFLTDLWTALLDSSIWSVRLP